ncbi:MAG: hypothetical protein KIT69_02275, partial [Propionibacteriaceae bacterium]|nr:hypothetical protein [Propionibacteriaceae bacterium]
AIDLAGVLASVRAAPDAVLAALLRCGDATAHRVVLQTMLGRAVLDAARDPLHDLGDYVAELWLGIATYPLSRRPSRIAANLALDTRKRVRGRRLVRPVDPVRLANSVQRADDADPSLAGLVLAEAHRAALITADTERALRLVYTEGLGTGQAAAVLGVAPAALRQRCARAVRRLAAHARELQEAIA